MQRLISAGEDMRAFNTTPQEEARRKKRNRFLRTIDPVVLVDQFPLFVDRQELSRYLARVELFRRILNVKGSIVECGVHRGASLMLFAQLSAIYEPYAFNRKIIGFDTFKGFPSVHRADGPHAAVGDMADVSLRTLRTAIRLYDTNRPLGHVPKIELVLGDATKTIPQYVSKHPHLLVALLYLDFDLYEPTKVALEAFVPRMPRGAVVAFDELGQARWPGESVAAFECLKLSELRLRKFPYEPHVSYCVL